MIDFVHVGLHKTGTTWLQKFWFPHQPGVRMLKETLGDAYRDLCLHFVSASPEEFDRELFRSKIKASLSQGGLTADKKIIGWSFEKLSGDVFTGAGSRQIAQRIYDTFGKTKVIICLRNQQDIIDSIYFQYIRLGGTLSPHEFLNRNDSRGSHLFQKLQYDQFVKCYCDIFGESNVHVLLYENFKSDKESFLSDLASHIGINAIQTNNCDYAHARISYAALKLIRFINMFSDSYINEKHPYTLSKTTRAALIKNIYSLNHTLFKKFFSKNYYSSNAKKKIQNIFFESNTNIPIVPSYDLQRHGYIKNTQ